MENEASFTQEDLDNCWVHQRIYFLDILNGEYDLAKAREDLRSLIGSEFDLRNMGEIKKS